MKTPLEKFAYERDEITTGLTRAGVTHVRFSPYPVPTEIPAAVVILDSKDGTLPTAHKYRDCELSWDIRIVVDATPHLHPDPDRDIFVLQEAFRAELIQRLGRDIGRVEFYASTGEKGRKVRVAKMVTRRAGA